LTGEIRILHSVHAADIGRLINPLQCRGQIDGAIGMALGWALTGDPVDVAALPADQTTVVLDFTQADRTLSVILTHGEAGTQVRLAQASAQK